MRWIGRRESGNVEDRRGMGGPIAIGGGLIGLIVFVVNMFLNNGTGGDAGTPQTKATQAEQGAPAAGDDELAKFSSVVLADNEDVWTQIFKENGKTYDPPKMVLFSNSTVSGCGNAISATGPFYCPADQKLYIDLTFFNELQTRFGASGDFAMAYVISHEVGHHVQYLLGTSDKVSAMEARADKKEANRLSVALELQADFYAGVWAHYDQKMKDVLEPGDIDEALNAASAVGDDRIQKETQGYVVPDAFTHGTSAQRMYWFKKGYETGDISQGKTFDEILK